MFINKKMGILTLLFIVLGFISLIILTDYFYYINRIHPGVYYKDMHLGGKNFQEVGELLNTSHFTFINPEDSEGKSVSIPLREMGINLDKNQMFIAGYWQSRPKPWPRGYGYRLKIKKEGVSIPSQYQINQELLSQSIDSLVKDFTREPENAYFKVNINNQVEIVPEKYGYLINNDDFKRVIMENLAQPNSPPEINIPIAEKIPPEITISSLMEKGIEDLMISFTTSFDPTATNRVHNIKLAANPLDNYFLAPGEVLSLNNVIGNTTVEKGYKLAPTIVGGELIAGIGGGLCQISSTLYNAALLANLEIYERHNHQLTVPYIDPGRDATISYPAKDLMFRNNKEHYILINTSVEKDELTFSFFGQPLEERVEININVLDTFPPWERYELDSELKPGEKEVIEGHPGYLVEVWKTVYRDEQKEREEKISVNRYSPYPKIIKLGPTD